MTTTGAQARIRMMREATYNTTPSGNYWNIPFTGSSLGVQQGNEKSPQIGVGSDPRAPFRGVKDGKGDISVPIDARNIGLHLAALFGDPVTTEPSGFQHVFKTGAVGQPVSQCLEVMHPGLTGGTQYAKNTGVLYTGMEVSLDRAGAATAKFMLVGTDEVWNGTSAAGTPAELENATLKSFSHLTGVIKRAGTALGVILSGSFSFTNNLDVAEVVANSGLIAGGTRSEAALSVKLNARFDNMTLLNDALTGDGVQIEWSLTNSSDEKITFLMPKVSFARPQVPVSGPSGLQVSLDGTGYAVAGGSDMMTITLLNDHDGTAYTA